MAARRERRIERSWMRVHRESADPAMVAVTLREFGFEALDLLPTRRFTQPDMAFALGVSPSAYENYERLVGGRPLRRPPVATLLLFGAVCGLRDVETLDRLWSQARGSNFPRTSNLVGLDVPDELRDLVLDDARELAARREVRREAALRGAALRAISHQLQHGEGDPNPYTAELPDAAATLAAAFAPHAPAGGGDLVARAVQAVQPGLQRAVRGWAEWELRRLETTPEPLDP
ncbi:hypothetical protein ACH4VT_33585 [Streptomyces lydicus]|uniref:hypothetical protein n=1 Tax=Streptomyces lydicus TaxID=47763 RepID=UPI00379D6E16